MIGKKPKRGAKFPGLGAIMEAWRRVQSYWLPKSIRAKLYLWQRAFARHPRIVLSVLYVIVVLVAIVFIPSMLVIWNGNTNQVASPSSAPTVRDVQPPNETDDPAIA